VLTTLPSSCADCLEIWEPQPLGSLRACRGLSRDCFTFTFTSVTWSIVQENDWRGHVVSAVCCGRICS